LDFAKVLFFKLLSMLLGCSTFEAGGHGVDRDHQGDSPVGFPPRGGEPEEGEGHEDRQRIVKPRSLLPVGCLQQ